MGTLYVIATPIGNLEDLTPRARRVLGEVSAIASEDTRHTGMLLKRLGIERPQVSYHAFNEASRIDQLLELLNAGDLALVTDAGTPGVSDPGALLVSMAAEAGHQIVPIPGPSALAAAMSASGFQEAPVLFLGFLPKKASERKSIMQDALASRASVYLFESPKRLVDTLKSVESIDAERPVVVFRELTKLHEEIVRGSASEVCSQFGSREAIKGEIVVGIGPKKASSTLPDEEVEALILELHEAGDSLSAVAREVASRSGLPRSEVYDRARRLIQGKKQRE